MARAKLYQRSDSLTLVVTPEGLDDDDYEVIRSSAPSVAFEAESLGFDDLSVLDPVARDIRVLRIVGSQIRNLSGLATLTNLEELFVDYSIRLPLNLAENARLKSFTGYIHAETQLPDGASLESARFYGSDFSSLDGWLGTVRDIEFIAEPRRRPVIVDLKVSLARTVERLAVEDAGRTEIIGLEAYESLRKIRFTNCRSVSDLSAIAHFPELMIVLQGVQELDEWRTLALPANGRAWIQGRSPFSPSFAESHSEQQGWFFSREVFPVPF